MKKLLAIADDFTGAAEIAGIGHRYGLPTRILRHPPTRIEPGLTVLDSDSRLRSAGDAAATVSRFAEPIRFEPFDLIFKKTDSVLRGPVAAELDALAAAVHLPSVLLVPQNPSRGRVIVDGEYRISDVPLNETSFADDPTHPVRSSKVAELLGPHDRAITIGNGATAADLREWASHVSPTALPAGGADFFTALLEHGGLHPVQPLLQQLPVGPRLFVFGSTHPYPAIPNVAARPMMESAEVWCDAICWLLSGGYDAMMTVDLPLDAAPGAAARIERHVATVAATALRRCPVRTVFVTGGATASAVCRAVEWSRFDVEGELAPGIVQLRPDRATETSLIVKPGSYAWPPQLGAKGLVSMTTLRGRRSRS